MPRRKSRCNSCWDNFLQFDIYGESVKLNIDGVDRYTTCLGACFTILTVVLVALYGVQRSQPFWLIEHPKISTFTHHDSIKKPFDFSQDTIDGKKIQFSSHPYKKNEKFMFAWAAENRFTGELKDNADYIYWEAHLEY